MIQTMTYRNPLNNCEEHLDIEIIEYIDKKDWEEYLNNLNSKFILDILKEIISDLDCTRIYKSGRPMMIDYPRYKILIGKYFKYLYLIKDPILYGIYFDILINRHIDNINFEFANPIIKDRPKKSKSSKSRPNRWIKAKTADLFTGEERYIYENLKTKEIINSTNPDLLEELNKPKERKKKDKSVVNNFNPKEGKIIFKFNK